MKTIKSILILSAALLGAEQLSAQVTVYENNNFGGKSQTFDKEGEYHLMKTIGDDVVSSIKVSPGWKATLQQHGVARKDRGTSIVLTSDAKELASKSFDNIASTLIVERIEPQNTSVVTVYEHINYGGKSKSFGVGVHDITETEFNDIISAVKVLKGYKVTLYKDWKATGETVVLTSDNSDLLKINFNDKTSSIKVEKL